MCVPAAGRARGHRRPKGKAHKHNCEPKPACPRRAGAPPGRGFTLRSFFVTDCTNQSIESWLMPCAPHTRLY
eukprot:4799141-Prymnesium_polylepis.1